MINKTSQHHLLCKSRWGSNIPKNVITLQDSLHRAIHRVFENKTPIEQLHYIKSFNSRVLNKEVVARINEVLWEFNDPEYVYKKGVLVPYKIYNK